jgi:hypothetical protein
LPIVLIIDTHFSESWRTANPEKENWRTGNLVVNTSRSFFENPKRSGVKRISTSIGCLKSKTLYKIEKPKAVPIQA